MMGRSDDSAETYDDPRMEAAYKRLKSIFWGESYDEDVKAFSKKHALRQGLCGA